jgi:hypothetical protein
LAAGRFTAAELLALGLALGLLLALEVLGLAVAFTTAFTLAFAFALDLAKAAFIGVLPGEAAAGLFRADPLPGLFPFPLVLLAKAAMGVVGAGRPSALAEGWSASGVSTASAAISAAIVKSN